MRTGNFNYRGTRRFSSRAPQAKRGGFSRFTKKNLRSERIDPSRFINKAVVDENTNKIENFVSEHKFQDFRIDQRLLRGVMNKGYNEPTPIQDQIIPHIIKGLDVVGIANTGTGKTAAFLIPLINKIIFNPREKVLIITPTRELALQIDQEFKGFSRGGGLRIFSVCCVGGMSIGRQISELKWNHNLVIGTPGRLKDLIERKFIVLPKFNTVVLDEADRMLDMGFINDTRFIVNGMPKERQSLFFSATIPFEVEKIVKEFLRNPIRVSVKTRDTSKNVEQDIVRVDRGKNKIDVLQNLLIKEEFNKVLIFGRTKHGVERLSKTLIGKGFRAESIHGNKNHVQRQRALNMFKDNRVQILVATDVAARGLDIADVSHVINFDMPSTYDEYIHRIGRTGRWNKRGMALTFID